uniref:Uncharacterized protein n=1 Tax=Helicotheca tamesis TaxID=374047 RepID=A0A7S2MMU0_9STRA|eukprot:CAMPEP_0185728950 /NCGR_PEP_ID=MMETSP1171-20130828/4382_1 /TAXON_ID=374046 /ORGANISM="Helicotheca tamensis, Strain CCMP826" /LENGTH=230 /DNA_ID=CAMNT_0028397707 /DNA_START=108 /DNA_END=800 /DNA_ORIENTATION=-
MPDIGSNGKIAPCVGLFSITAFALSLTATFSCQFISQSGKKVLEEHIKAPDFPVAATLHQGFWSFEITGSDHDVFNTDGCTEYPDYWDTNFGSWPSQFTAARVFSIFTVVVGMVLMFVGCCAACLPMPGLALKCIGLGFFFQTLFEGLKFLIVLDRKNYSLEYGANCCIAATSFYFVCMLMSCCGLKSSEEEEEDAAASKAVDDPEKDEAPKNEEDPEPKENPEPEAAAE